MKILVLGSGGREHALVHTFYRQGHEVFCHPGNPGMLSLAAPLTKQPHSMDNHAYLAHLAREAKIDLTVVGPEAPLEKGIADLFASQNLPLFGPTRLAAQMESSKAWAKGFMAKHRIPTARFSVCRSQKAATDAARSLFEEGKGAVIKPSGLTGGKGVVCCATYEEAAAAIRQIVEEKLYGSAGEELVVEELLSGPEVSLQVICDGETMLPLIAAQDHKRLLDGDLGPNTGGMGAYAPLPFVDAQVMRTIEETVVEPTRLGLKRERIVYRGVLYFGLMLTKEGPKVLEYNCRLGDPETEAILPLLESDLASLMMAAVRGELHAQEIRWKPLSSCCVVLASEGYPQAPVTGRAIGELQGRDDLLFFHASTALDERGRLATAGGRVLAVTGLGADFEEAAAKVYGAIENKFAWAHFRRDVGRAALPTSV